MSRLTLRTSTIFIGTAKRTRVYSSLKEIPPKLREKLISSTSGTNSATILIADRRGRKELSRAVRGLPTTPEPKPETSPEPAAARVSRLRRWMVPLSVWAEVLVAGGLGLLIWLLLTAR